MFNFLLDRFRPSLHQAPMVSPVQVWSEFDPLEEVILGRAYPSQHFSYLKDEDFKTQMVQILEETEEDLLKLKGILESLGVTVKRPDVCFELHKGDDPYIFDLQRFSFSFPNHPLMPRDTLFAYGNTLLECYTASSSRYFENANYYNLLRDYFKAGANWLSMPPPPLRDGQRGYSDLMGRGLVYHAANLLRCGRDIFYSYPSTADGHWTGKGTEEGLDWIRRQLPSAQFHPAPCQGHLDGKLAILKPGVVATWSKKFVPEKMRNWEVIVVESPNPFPEAFNSLRKRRFYKEFVTDWLTEWIGYVDETVFDINMLSIDSKTVITNGYNKKAFADFKRNGVECIPWSFRHQYFWDGAIHCVTLDTRRRGTQENYF